MRNYFLGLYAPISSSKASFTFNRCSFFAYISASSSREQQNLLRLKKSICSEKIFIMLDIIFLCSCNISCSDNVEINILCKPANSYQVGNKRASASVTARAVNAATSAAITGTLAQSVCAYVLHICAPISTAQYANKRSSITS